MRSLKEKLAAIVGSAGWELFTRFDAYEKATIEGREDGCGFAQEERDAMFMKLPRPLVTAYQYEVREMVNPKHQCGGCYRTLSPSKIGA
jgi:hypothetical protein